MHEEISPGLFSANRCLYGLNNTFKSKLLSKKSKEQLSYIRFVMAYACANDERERGKTTCIRVESLYRKISGPVFNNIEYKWEIRTNVQLYQLYKRDDVV